ncbi:pyridoxamine 5'-phosphate oxidase family protein [Uniformispora flossi]|uniref:pyridoxamine 5'-phosphate oxidase family protein n=1 Tax=Uniformispora flossi TaxID=3390723 RepID=UPI003C2EDAF8
MGVALSDDEAWEVLAAAHTGILTTMRADGFPVTLPVWFAVRDREILVAGPAATHKFTRVRKDDKVAFLVESGERWTDLRAVQISGRAVVDPAPDWADVDALFDAKYAGFRTPRAEMPESARVRYDSRRALLRITPERAPISWDNRRLAGGR